jgi:signal transduction histidine kinase
MRADPAPTAAPQALPRAVARYAAAGAIVLAALALRFATSGFFTEYGFPFICFFPAVLIAAFATGLGPSLFAVALSTGFAWYFFIHPKDAFLPISDTDLFALCFFVAVLVVDCLVIHVARRSLQRLRLAQAELQAADDRKNEFLAFLAHELRNPLSAVKSAGLLAARQASDGAARRTLEMQQRQIAQMERLIGDLLDGARLASGKIHVEEAPLDLAVLVERSAQAFRLLADARGQTVALSLPPGPVPVSGDASRLSQVVENLLSNASKFSPDGALLRVGLAIDGNGAELTVADPGKGLEAADLDRIFEMYVQTQQSDVQKGGLGLGLPLARHIAQRHGGSIVARSAGRGHGATFLLRLPLDSAPQG